MTSRECLALLEEAEKQGIKTWDDLIAWIDQTKGIEIRLAFELRCKSSPL